eukprot:527605-Pleurochrysis_carterae.AAC.1
MHTAMKTLKLRVEAAFGGQEDPTSRKRQGKPKDHRVDEGVSEPGRKPAVIPTNLKGWGHVKLRK